MNCTPMHLDLVWLVYYIKNNRVRDESFVMPVEYLPKLRGTTDPIRWGSVSSIPYVEYLAISPDLVKDDIDDVTAGIPTSDIID